MARKNTPTESTVIHPAEQYALDVVAGIIPANRWVRLACERHLRDKEDGEARGLYHDADAGNRIIRFFQEYLRFYEGEFDNKPFLLQPWQQFILWCLFGWKTADGYRRFRTAYIEIAKGNGKSPLAAGVGLYGLVKDGEPGAEIYSSAVTKEQAGILFRDARAFAEGSPALSSRLDIGQHNIAHHSSNSYFRPVSSEHRGLDGKRPHMALIDEIHEHPTSIVVDKMRLGTKGRRSALLLEITNAGYDRQSVCFQHHDMSEKILQGIIDNDSWFAYMTGIDPCPKCIADGKTIPQEGCPDCDDWRDESTWIKSNPNLDVSVTKRYLREVVAEAVAMPAKQNLVKRLNFCIWTESAVKWLSSDAWNACNTMIPIDLLKYRPAYGGLDLSSNSDITALVWVFPPMDDDHDEYGVLCRFFLPEDTVAERVKRDRIPYDVWVREGYITATPGNIIDYDYILNTIDDDCAAFNVRELAFDRWGSQKITTDLQKLGFEIRSESTTKETNAQTLVQFGQGFASMNSPAKELEKIVVAKALAHGGNPVLAWMASNVVIESDAAGNIKPSKAKSTEKIDGIVALLMALARATQCMNEESIYSEEGLTLI